MKLLGCSNCGANGLVKKNGYMLCEFCNSRFAIEGSDFPQESIGMTLNTDVENLLRKCRTDSKNAKKYANLILDIDPTNQKAWKYL